MVNRVFELCFSHEHHNITQYNTRSESVKCHITSVVLGLPIRFSFKRVKVRLIFSHFVNIHG